MPRNNHTYLFDFLKKIEEENFNYHLNYRAGLQVVEVNVDAYNEKMSVLFDRNGLHTVSVFKSQELEEESFTSKIDSLFCRPEKAWLKAKEELGITVETPFKFLGKDGNTYQVTALLPDFGGKLGTIVVTRKDQSLDILHSEFLEGYNFSALNSYSYDEFDRDIFIDTLKDWGWNKQDSPPDWYTK